MTRHRLRPTRLIFFSTAIAVLLLPARPTAAQEEVPVPPREYQLYLATDRDLRVSALIAITVFRGAQDAFTHGIRPHLPEGVAGVAGGVWSFGTTYLALVWSHEFGHVFRAAQVGGEFRIHDVARPIPTYRRPRP